jgi:hypothetical protein
VPSTRGCERPSTSGAVWASVLRYQWSDSSTYEPVPGSSNQRTVAVGEQQVQPIGMAVPTAERP